MTRLDLIAYIADNYGVDPEYLWESDPAACVFRNPYNRKWFAIIMRVRRRSLGQDSDEFVDVVDFKAQNAAENTNSRLLPGYHMNKRHWLTIILDDAPDATFVFEQINRSHVLVATGKH